MTDIEIFEELKNIIEKEFGIPKEHVEEDFSLDEDLNITDLEIEDLITKIEEAFSIKIPQEEIENFKKVQDIVTYLYENIDSNT